MKKTTVSLAALILLTTFLSGCNSFPAAAVKTNSLDGGIDYSKYNQTPIVMNIDLPVKKLVIVSGGTPHEFEVEIASTNPQREVGLMNRKNLDEKKGMLFVFETSGYLNFWMKNTLIPLDMLFIDEQGFIKHITRKAQPCLSRNNADCPLFNSEEQVRYVLEVNGGTADKLGIIEGDKVSWL